MLSLNLIFYTYEIMLKSEMIWKWATLQVALEWNHPGTAKTIGAPTSRTRLFSSAMWASHSRITWALSKCPISCHDAEKISDFFSAEMSSEHQLLRTPQSPTLGAASSRTPVSAAEHVELSPGPGWEFRVPKFGTRLKQNSNHKQKNWPLYQIPLSGVVQNCWTPQIGLVNTK